MCFANSLYFHFLIREFTIHFAKIPKIRHRFREFTIFSLSISRSHYEFTIFFCEITLKATSCSRIDYWYIFYESSLCSKTRIHLSRFGKSPLRPFGWCVYIVILGQFIGQKRSTLTTVIDKKLSDRCNHKTAHSFTESAGKGRRIQTVCFG